MNENGDLPFPLIDIDDDYSNNVLNYNNNQFNNNNNYQFNNSNNQFNNSNNHFNNNNNHHFNNNNNNNNNQSNSKKNGKKNKSKTSDGPRKSECFDPFCGEKCELLGYQTLCKKCYKKLNVDNESGRSFGVLTKDQIDVFKVFVKPINERSIKKTKDFLKYLVGHHLDLKAGRINNNTWKRCHMVYGKMVVGCLYRKSDTEIYAVLLNSYFECYHPFFNDSNKIKGLERMIYEPNCGSNKLGHFVINLETNLEKVSCETFCVTADCENNCKTNCNFMRVKEEKEPMSDDQLVVEVPPNCDINIPRSGAESPILFGVLNASTSSNSNTNNSHNIARSSSAQPMHISSFQQSNNDLSSSQELNLSNLQCCIPGCERKIANQNGICGMNIHHVTKQTHNFFHRNYAVSDCSRRYEKKDADTLEVVIGGSAVVISKKDSVFSQTVFSNEYAISEIIEAMYFTNGHEYYQQDNDGHLVVSVTFANQDKQEVVCLRCDRDTSSIGKKRKHNMQVFRGNSFGEAHRSSISNNGNIQEENMDNLLLDTMVALSVSRLDRIKNSKNNYSPNSQCSDSDDELQQKMALLNLTTDYSGVDTKNVSLPCTNSKTTAVKPYESPNSKDMTPPNAKGKTKGTFVKPYNSANSKNMTPPNAKGKTKGTFVKPDYNAVDSNHMSPPKAKSKSKPTAVKPDYNGVDSNHISPPKAKAKSTRKSMKPDYNPVPSNHVSPPNSKGKSNQNLPNSTVAKKRTVYRGVIPNQQDRVEQESNQTNSNTKFNTIQKYGLFDAKPYSYATAVKSQSDNSVSEVKAKRQSKYYDRNNVVTKRN